MPRSPRKPRPPWDAVIDALPLGLCLLDDQFNVRAWNLALADLTGTAPDAALGRPVFESLPDWPSDQLAVRCREALDADRLTQLDAVTIAAPGRHAARRTLHVTVHPLPARHRPAYTLLLAIEDRTPSAALADRNTDLEARLRRAQRLEAVGQLAGGVAHEFNNILTALLGNLELLRQQINGTLPPDDARARHLTEIEAAAGRAATLARQMVAFSRRLPLRRAPLDLNDVIRETERLVRRLITEDVTLTYRLAPNLDLVYADVGEIEQILVNLVLTARETLPAGGSIAVATGNIALHDTYVAAHPDARPGPHVVLTVQDTGAGLSDAIIAQALGTATVPGGLSAAGLGLAAIARIVRQGGGHVTVESVADRGTTCRVYLPATASAPAAAVEPDEDEAALTGRETIVVCEDDDGVRELTTRFLQAAGYRVFPADSAAGALMQAEQLAGRMDLLLTDVVMPDMSGRRLAEDVQRHCPRTRTAFISGYTADVLATQGLEVGDVAILGKPFSRRGLLRHVRAVLDGHPR